MKKQDTNNERLINELESLRQRVAELEQSEARLKGTEKLLRESEERFRLLYENAPLGYQSLDENGYFLDINQAWLATLGFSREEVIGKWFGDFLAPGCKEHFKTNFPKFKAAGEIHGVEFEMLRKDGSQIAVAFDGQIARDEQGRFKQTHCILHDITERKRAEEAIKGSEARVRMKLDSILSPEGDIGTLELADVIDAQAIQALMDDFYSLTNIGVGIIDRQGKVLVATGWQEICIKFHLAHPETCKYCVESDTELSGSPELGSFRLYRCKNNMWDIATPIIVAGKHLGNIFLGQFLFEDETPDYETFRFQARQYGFDEQQYLAALDKVPRWSRQTVDTTMTFYAKLAGILSTLSYSNIKLARSLAEEQRLLSSLRDNQQRYKAVVDNIEIGISLLNANMEIVEVNRAFREYFPHVRPSCGQICYEQYNDPPRSKPCSYCPCVLTLQDGKVHEAITETPAGAEVRHYRLVSSPIKDSEGRVQYVIELTEDITERKKAQESLDRANQEWEQTFNAISDLVMVLDHEHKILRANKAMTDAFGMTELGLIGKRCFELVHGEQHPPAFCPHSQLLADGEEHSVEVVEPRLGGIYDVRVSPLIDQNGQVIGSVHVTRDITERKKAEDELRASEERFRSLFENSPISIWEEDFSEVKALLSDLQEEGVDDLEAYFQQHPEVVNQCAELVRITNVNQASLEMYEAAGKEELCRGLAKTFTPESSATFGRELISLWNGQTGMVSDSVLQTLSGKLLQVIVYFSVCPGFEQTLSKVLVSTIDITERKQVQGELQKSNDLLRAIIEAAPTAIMGLDLDGNVQTVWNPAAEKMLGWSAEEIMGRRLPSVPVENQEEFKSFRERIRDGETMDGVEVRRQKRDGSPIDYSIYASPLHDAEGRITGNIAVLVDITERKRAEEALREREAFYRSLYENISDYIFIIDVTTDQRFKFVSFNPAAETALNMITEQVADKFADDLLPKDLAELVTSRCQMCVKNRRVIHGEEVLDLPKATVSLYTSLAPIEGPDGRIYRIIGIARDITEQKGLQRQLLQAQKMEAIGTLAGGIAHDFNNLLTVILGFSELLLIRRGEGDPAYANIQKINQAARNAADLVKRILTFSRKAEISPHPLNLNHEVEQARNLLSRTIPKMIEIELILSDELTTVNADPAQVQQILINLAVNAKDAMPDGGKLAIETKNVTLDEEYCRLHLETKPGNYVVLSVSDTGHGMDKETLQHVFEPFFTTKDTGLGTGLGLAMVYGIVKQHGGFITCYSEPGAGTAFKIYLPVIPTETESETPLCTSALPTGTETILLVDDEEMIRDLGKTILAESGYKVFTAVNGKEALDLYEKERDKISLIILDLNMPEMGGKECLQKLLGINPQVKVLVASGFTANGQTKEAIETGARGFVDKPYDVKAMLHAVREVLDSD